MSLPFDLHKFGSTALLNCDLALGEHPHAVSRHFAHFDQLAGGLAPPGLCPCWAHQAKKGTEFPQCPFTDNVSNLPAYLTGAAAVVVAGTALVGVAGACANEATAIPDKREPAIRVLIFNMD